ncbi:hypothetical protein YO5_08168 [Stutzerimonas stutzeri TS44]|nr:hypothetical protein YO5_08168 [Stutzerimonas stutzeri TS44]
MQAFQVGLDDFGARRPRIGCGCRIGCDGIALSLSSPCLELTSNGRLDDAEQVACRFAHLAAATACRPFVEHRLPLFGLDLLQSHQSTGLLFFFQRQKTLGQLQILEFLRARYCTYFIYTITKYFSTVLLRNPKRVGFAGFRACFGIRKQWFTIPKKGVAAFFGFVAGLLLWITI